MRSVLTTSSGRLQTVYNGSRDGAEWTQIPDGEYVHPRDAPRGYTQERYLKAATTSRAWDAETASLGILRWAIISIDAPEEIPNDGTATDISLSTEAADAITVKLTVDDYTESITVDGETVEQVETTISAGETIEIIVDGNGVERTTASMEVVKA